MLPRLTAEGLADSRDIAASFGRRHHNVLSAIDLVLRDCPEAAPHVRFDQHPVTAGLGGTRNVRHALVDRCGFMLLAMTMPSNARLMALAWVRCFDSGTMEGTRENLPLAEEACALKQLSASSPMGVATRTSDS